METTFYMYPARTRRYALGWTQKELADKAGVSTVSVQKIERGASMRPSVAKKIMNALGFTDKKLIELTSQYL